MSYKCYKVGFSSKKKAERALKKQVFQNKMKYKSGGINITKRKQVQAVYKCSHCGEFHLTSKDQDLIKNSRR